MRFKLLHALTGLIIVTQSVTSWAKNDTGRDIATTPQREVFHCTLLISNEFRDGSRQRNLVDIASPQPVILGVGEDAFDLQTIFESEAIREAYFGRFQFLGTIYWDENGVKKVKMGIYNIGVNMAGYTEATHHIIRTREGASTYYAHPVMEVKANFEPRGEYLLESTGTIGASTFARFTKLKCTHQSTVTASVL